ncbi:alpha/beta fold hydrolase [Candidatus Woesearchaeota archaeon]|nr:alpha/beta fold hydrolase [Candidatus Woesearchaeota archaeon]
MSPNKTWLFAILIITVAITGCLGKPVRGPGREMLYSTVQLNTSDGVLITASYYDSDADKGLILLHMLARDRHTFDDAAKRLQPHYKIIIPDLRGHGDSEGEYLDLTEKDFRDMVYDIESVANYLKEEEQAASISVAGASIGANLALTYASEHPVDKLLLISPGSRYRGIDISRISYGKPLLAQVGHYDGYSSISTDDLALNWQRGRVMEYDTNAHGTDLIKTDLSASEDFFFYLT